MARPRTDEQEAVVAISRAEAVVPERRVTGQRGAVTEFGAVLESHLAGPGKSPAGADDGHGAGVERLVAVVETHGMQHGRAHLRRDPAAFPECVDVRVADE
jgi:hypothetical protein